MELSTGPRAHVSFEIERVIGVSSDGCYQVQWAPAWVNRYHLVGCEHLIQEFLLGQAEDESKTGEPVSNRWEQDTEIDSSVIQCLGRVSKLTDVREHCDSSQLGGVTNEASKTNVQGPSHNHQIENATNMGSKTVDEPNDFLINSSETDIKIEEIDELMVSSPSHPSAFFSVDMNKKSGDAIQVHSSLNPNLRTEENWKPTGDHNVENSDSVTNYEPIFCQHCNKNFEGSSLFKQHHCPQDIEQPYPSSHYSLIVADKSRLKRLTHPNENPLTCNYCGKLFPCKSDLVKHIRIHTGVKPYSCESCGKHFSQSSSRNRHARTCHSTTEQNTISLGLSPL